MSAHVKNMQVTRKNIFVTGPPGCGKSTLIEKAVAQIKNPATGFFTREIRKQGRRTGFSITNLHGKHGVLAHETIQGRPREGVQVWRKPSRH